MGTSMLNSNSSYDCCVCFCTTPFAVASSPKLRYTEEMNSYLIKTTTAIPSSGNVVASGVLKINNSKNGL